MKLNWNGIEKENGGIQQQWNKAKNKEVIV